MTLTLDSAALVFFLLAAILAGVAFQARRLGNEKRDVALLGAFSGLCGAGAAVTALL